MVAVIVAMALVDEVRAQLWWSLGSLAVVLLAAWLHTRRSEAPQRARPGRTAMPRRVSGGLPRRVMAGGPGERQRRH